MAKLITLGLGSTQLLPTIGFGGVTTNALVLSPGQGYLTGGPTYIIATEGPINSTQFNDAFDLDIIDTSIWSVATMGQTKYIAGNGLKVTVGPTAGSSFTLTSRVAYTAGDAQFTFALIGNAIANPPAVMVDYASLTLKLGSDYLMIARSYDPAVGQILRTVAVIGGIAYPAQAIATSSTGGTLRIVYFNGSGTTGAPSGLYAYYIDTTTGTTTTLFSVVIGLFTAATDGTFSISTDNEGNTGSVSASYVSFVINNVVTFGNNPDLTATYPTNNRILGNVPPSSVTGNVPVIVWTFRGAQVTDLNGLTYIPSPTARVLTSNRGISLITSSDPAISS
jgi:hypothetical protein